MNNKYFKYFLSVIPVGLAIGALIFVLPRAEMKERYVNPTTHKLVEEYERILSENGVIDDTGPLLELVFFCDITVTFDSEVRNLCTRVERVFHTNNSRRHSRYYLDALAEARNVR